MKIVCSDEDKELGITHKAHREHFCTLVRFDYSNKNFWTHEGFATWMPRDIEVFALVKMMLGISPRFRALFSSEFAIKNLQQEKFSNPLSSLAEDSNNSIGNEGGVN